MEFGKTWRDGVCLEVLAVWDALHQLPAVLPHAKLGKHSTLCVCVVHGGTHAARPNQPRWSASFTLSVARSEQLK